MVISKETRWIARDRGGSEGQRERERGGGGLVGSNTERKPGRERERERERETDRQTDRQTDRPTERQTDRERDTNRQTDRQRERGTDRQSRPTQSATGQPTATNEEQRAWTTGTWSRVSGHHTTRRHRYRHNVNDTKSWYWIDQLTTARQLTNTVDGKDSREGNDHRVSLKSADDHKLVTGTDRAKWRRAYKQAPALRNKILNVSFLLASEAQNRSTMPSYTRVNILVLASGAQTA